MNYKNMKISSSNNVSFQDPVDLDPKCARTKKVMVYYRSSP